jgi:hypothetical protein
MAGDLLKGTCKPFPATGDACAMDAIFGGGNTLDHQAEKSDVDGFFGFRATCDSTSWCAVSGNTTGVCKARGGQGFLCLDDSYCQAGFVCNDGGCSSSPHFSALGQPCLDDDGCEAGLFCTGSQDVEPGVCKMPRPDGSACYEISGCKGHCASMDATGQGTCASLCSSG